MTVSLFKSAVQRRIPIIIFLVLYLSITILTFKDYGGTVDEFNVYTRGELFYNKIRGNDQILQKDFVILREDNQLPLYNNVYATLLYILNDSGDLEIYHLMNMFITSVIFISIYELLLLYTKNPIYAILGPILLLLTPRFSGHIPANPKDIPFAISYFLSLTAIVFTRKMDEKTRILMLGILFGVTQGLRTIGFSIYLVYGIMQLLDLKKDHIVIKLKNMFVEILLIFMLGFLMHMLSVPFIGADPYNNLITLLQTSKSFLLWEGQVLIWGEYYKSTQIPWHYLPSWILITTPIMTLIFSFYGVLKGNKSNYVYRLILIALGVNLSLFFAMQPIIYNGLRHMLFLVPFIIFFASIGIFHFLNSSNFSKHIRFIGVFLVVINMIFVLNQIIRLYPYQYTYFNEIVGGVKGAYQRFELDYWAAANKEASIWLDQYLKRYDSATVRIFICANDYQVKQTLQYPVTYVPIEEYKMADYTICWERDDDHLLIDGSIIHTVSREGIPYVHVIKNSQVPYELGK